MGPIGLMGAGCGEIAEPPILQPGGPGAASNLRASQDCDSEVLRKGIALLEWEIAREPGSEQKVEVTIFREGFETGNSIPSKPLPGDQTELRFDRVAGQALHRWRVLTLHGEGYVPSETARFTGPICVYDEAEVEDQIPPIP